MPAGRVDQWIPVKPGACHRCGQRLTGEDPHPRRHQQVVIPPVRAEVLEYQLHTLRCPACDRLTEADGPAGVSLRTFGPSVQAWVGLLAGAYRLSHRNIVALLSDAFGVELSVGTVSPLQQEVSAALAAPMQEAGAYVRQQPRVNMDETGWRQGRAKAWLWTAVTPGVLGLRHSPEPRPGGGRGVARRRQPGGGRLGSVLGLRASAAGALASVLGPTCGAPSRTFRPAPDRPPASASSCWTTPIRCLPGGIGCAPAPCNAPASRSMPARCGGAFVWPCGRGNSSPTPGRRRPAATCSTSSRRCGPSPAGRAWSRRTTRPNEPFAMACCGATPASAATVPTAAASRSACSRCATPCASNSAASSTISPRPVTPPLHQQPAPSLLPQTNSLLR